MVGAPSTSTSLKEYLKKYQNNDDEEKKRKKKKKKVKPDPAGVLVVDEDPVWQKPVKLEEEDDDSADEEKPLIDEDIEVKRMKRLEQLRLRRPFGGILEDGSGWVSISDAPKNVKSFEGTTDMSPPRQRRPSDDTPSPRLEQKVTTVDSDLSPPRQPLKYRQSLSPEPRGRRARNDSLSPEPHLEAAKSAKEVRDLSPPRRLRRHQLTPSPEPGRRSSHLLALDSDISPPRRSSSQRLLDSGRGNSDAQGMSDISPPRRVRSSSQRQNDSFVSSAADLSPPRKTKKDRSPSFGGSSRPTSHRFDESTVSDLSPPRKRRKDSPSSLRSKTGLVTGGDIKEEISRKKKEDLMRFEEMDPSMSGRNAEPVYRNKVTGERISKEEFLQLQKKGKRKEEKSKEIKLEWGKGLAQKREAEARLQELELEKDKPFARSRDDPERDKMLKERVRWGDPMAHLVKKKQFDPVLPDLGENEKMKESGFIIPQEIPSHSWIRRGLDAAPNRYGIKPGRHWDGVDRSNGFEKELFKRMNERKATEREAYLWSVSDM